MLSRAFLRDCSITTTIISVYTRNRDAARKAARSFARRVRNHDDADAWHGLGVLLVALGDRVGALAAFRNALRLDDARIDSQRALGNLLFDAGQCERALRCFAAAASR